MPKDRWDFLLDYTDADLREITAHKRKSAECADGVDDEAAAEARETAERLEEELAARKERNKWLENLW